MRKLGGNLAGSCSLPVPGVEPPLTKPDLFLMLGRGDIRRSWSSIMSASVEPGNGEFALLPINSFFFYYDAIFILFLIYCNIIYFYYKYI